MLAYRTDINGLRALAILSVVIFHLKENILPAGFVGVDIFFVISGFLITKIIIKDFRTDSFTFVHFYLRRIRRILPALFVLFIFCIIFSALITSPQDMLWFAKTLKYGALQASNFLFQRDVGYFDPPHEGMVLLHTWSLSVEEQFYVIWPIILALLFKFKKNENTIFYTLVSIVLLSLFFSQYLVIYNQKIAFFSLPSRLWELGIGGVLAFNRIKFSSQRINESLGIFGIFLILASFFVISEHNFPGVYALMPCIGTALVIISGNSKTLATRLLSNNIFNFFGLISYSLYLWHFPIISFYQEFFGNYDLSLIASLMLFMVSVIAACLSYQYVETPFRRKKIEEEKSVTVSFSSFSKTCKIRVYYPIGLSFIAIVIFVFISLNIKSSKGWEGRVYDKNIGYFNDDDLDEVEIFDPSCHVKSKQFNQGKRFPDDITKCSIGENKNGSEILLLGDSHLGHYGKGLLNFINKNSANRSIIQLTGGGCSFILDMNFSRNNRSYQKRCDYTVAKMKEVLLENKNIEHVILGARWNLYPDKLIDIEGDIKKNFTKKFYKTIDYLRRLDKKIIILGQTPVLGSHMEYPLKCFRGKNSPLRRYISKLIDVADANEDCLAYDREESTPNYEYFNALFTEISSQYQNIQYFDPVKFFCDDEKCYSVKNDKIIYYDNNHLNSYGSEYIGNYFDFKL